MATIKPIEGRSVHQIQSGQVIVDLCSVVKELVENSLDAGATSIEVRLKSNGLDAVEVQDNGDGISPQNYETVALKHYTSKLSEYADLSTLRTFGFRGEALSSLCALSTFTVATARAEGAPKGTKLSFDTSGKLRDKQVVACQKGTIVTVEGLFQNLPVRRRELEKNIKREYGKALTVLHAYACISTGVRFVVSNQMAKGKRATVFATKSNATTRENIANVYGAKTLLALVPLTLTLELEMTRPLGQRWSNEGDDGTRTIHIEGHISRPSFGEGRQTPDRQMFFVNARPCALPQVAKAVNEVYKSYNLSQSPFIFADLKMDTNSYDVNVSPDKRTILLHDQSKMLESLKESLTALFEGEEQTVPQSQKLTQKQPAYRQLTIQRETTLASDDSASIVAEVANEVDEGGCPDGAPEDQHIEALNADDYRADSAREEDSSRNTQAATIHPPGEASEVYATKLLRSEVKIVSSPNKVQLDSKAPKVGDESTRPRGLVEDFNKRIAEQSAGSRVGDIPARPADRETEDQERSQIPALSPIAHRPAFGVVQEAFDRVRPRRTAPEIATITIGSHTTTSPIGTPSRKRQRVEEPRANRTSGSHAAGTKRTARKPNFAQGLRSFAAPGTQPNESEEEDGCDSEDGVAACQSDDQADDPEDEPSEETEESKHEAVQSPSLPVSEVDREQSEEESDDMYIDEAEKKIREEAHVQRLIQEAEEEAARPSDDTVKGANAIVKGGGKRHEETYQLTQRLDMTLKGIESQLQRMGQTLGSLRDSLTADQEEADETDRISPEEKLSLTVSKSDFARMRIIGQFNLGFIIASRPSPSSLTSSPAFPSDLFIIDQHASDEKFNFERLQTSTVIETQRLVHPRTLSLTAIEEEILIDNLPVLEKNGFLFDIDHEGDQPVGRRCTLKCLPTSREVIFDVRDLEELLAILAETPTTTSSNMVSESRDDGTPSAGAVTIPRPSKTRRLLASRACRSSIMIGRVLTPAQMQRVTRNMGALDKPWNCPHGRPTMRHLLGVGGWKGWIEGDERGDGEMES